MQNSSINTRVTRKKHSGIIPTHKQGPRHRTTVEGWRRIDRESSVSHESKVGMSGQEAWSYQGLNRHHRTQMEGVEGLVRQVPQVMACKGGITPPSTRLQHLVDSKILLEKKRRSNTAGFPEPWERDQVKASLKASTPAILPSGAKRRPCS